MPRDGLKIKCARKRVVAARQAEVVELIGESMSNNTRSFNAQLISVFIR